MKKSAFLVLFAICAMAMNASVFSQYAGAYKMEASKTEAAAQPGMPEISIIQSGTMNLAANDAIAYDGAITVQVALKNGDFENKLNFVFEVSYTGKAEWDGEQAIQNVNKESVKFNFKEASAEKNDAMAEAMLGAFEEAASRFGDEIKRELCDRTSHYSVKTLSEEQIVLVDDDNVEWTLTPVK